MIIKKISAKVPLLYTKKPQDTCDIKLEQKYCMVRNNVIFINKSRRMNLMKTVISAFYLFIYIIHWVLSIPC